MITACYCADRPMYELLPTTVNSLLKTNDQNIDKIYLFIEDDEIPYINHPKIEFVNCENYDFFVRDGINISKRFPYMAMVRCFIYRVLKEDRVLYLDVDTIVDGDLTELWNFDQNEVLYGREEHDDYINSGVLLMNLKKMRELNYDKLLYGLLQRAKFIFPDQDIINVVYRQHIKKIDYKWNAVGNDRVYNYPVVIRHWAGQVKPWLEDATEKDKAFWNKYKTDFIKEDD